MKDELLRQLVIRSAEEVFETMMSLQITAEEISGEPLFNGKFHLCATIGFAGKWNGFISLQCSEDLACRVTSKMLSSDTTDVEKNEVRDAMGEVVNMVGGKFKAFFAEAFNSGIEAFKMSIPSVTMGKNYQLFVVGSETMPETVLKTDGESFSVKVVLKKSDAKIRIKTCRC